MNEHTAHKRISYSQISLFQKCPLSYRFRYIEKKPSKPSPYLSFGTSVHKVLSQFYEEYDGRFPSFSLLESLLDKNWVSEGYANSEEELQWKKNALSALRNFYEKTDLSKKRPLEFEEWFEIPFADFTLVGKIDRVDRTDNGRLHVIDYKTGGKLQSHEQVKKDLQLAIYYYACRYKYKEDPEKVGLYFLTQNEIISAELTEIEVQEAVKNILETYQNISRAIDEDSFAANVSKLCDYCDYLEFCPAANKTTYTQPPFPELPVTFEERLKQHLEKLISIEENFERLKIERESIERELIKEMEKNEERKLKLEDFIVELVEGTRYSTDESRLIEILKKHSLFENVVNINIRALMAILRNESIPEDAREEIQSLIHVNEVVRKIRVTRIVEQ